MYVQSGPNKSLRIGLEEKGLRSSKIYNLLTSITFLNLENREKFMPFFNKLSSGFLELHNFFSTHLKKL